MGNKIANKKSFTKYNLGFTIVELLVVIVVIGVLASMTLISYSGISQKAEITAIQSDLDNSSKKLKLYYTLYGGFPTAMPINAEGKYCPSGPTVDNAYCIKPTEGTFTYESSDPTTDFKLTETNGTLNYFITKNTSPAIVDAEWITIGAQTWAKTNLNVGTMVTGATAQTDNSTLEKYCYNNLESNCTTYGALYQWGEAMHYVTTEGAQGVCPTGSHIPTDNEWKILEMQLGMTQEQADLVMAWRGIDQGTKLKTSGSSGLNVPLAGYRYPDESFYALGSGTRLWSSSRYNTNDTWRRYLFSSKATVDRNAESKAYGSSVRCLKN